MIKRIGITLGWFLLIAVLYLIGVGVAALAGPKWNGDSSVWASGAPTGFLVALAAGAAFGIVMLTGAVLVAWWKWVKNG